MSWPLIEGLTIKILEYMTRALAGAAGRRTCWWRSWRRRCRWTSWPLIEGLTIKILGYMTRALPGGGREADLLVAQLAAAMPVDVMAGAADPANQALPQQALHACLFAHAAAYPALHRRAAPAHGPAEHPSQFYTENNKMHACLFAHAAACPALHRRAASALVCRALC